MKCKSKMWSVALGWLGAVAASGCGVEDFSAAPATRDEAPAASQIEGELSKPDDALRDKIRLTAEKAGRVFFDAQGNADTTHFDLRTTAVRDAAAPARMAWATPHRPERADVDTMFQALGIVRGGQIAAADFRGPATAWAMYDPTGRGYFTRADVAEVRALGRFRGERARAGRIVKALDGNRDGVLTPSEIAANSGAARVFAKIDPTHTTTFTVSTLAWSLAKSKAARRLALMHR